MLAGGLVSAAGTAEQRAEVLGAVAAGERVLAVAHDEPDGPRWATDAPGTTAAQDGDGWTLTGTKDPVLHGARADQVVVTAALPEGGTGLFLVDPAAAGDTPTAPATRRTTAGAPPGSSSTPPRPCRWATPGRDRSATIATHARHHPGRWRPTRRSGVMQAQLARHDDYLTSRKQFGVTLNTFQALTFRAADMYVSLELTHSVVDWATMVIASGDPEDDRRGGRPGRAAGQPGRAPHRPGGDPAARRHRDDGGVLRRRRHRPPGRARALARRRRSTTSAPLAAGVTDHDTLEALG